MNISVNGTEVDFDKGNILSLLDRYSIKPDSVVVERNGEIVHRETYSESIVNDGDTIEIVKFVGGG